MTPRIRLILTILLLTAVGCAPSLEAARSRSIYQAPGVSQIQRDDQRCQSLSRAESALRYVSVGAAVLGGGSGLASIPTDDEVRTGLAITAAGFAVAAGTTEAVRAQIAADYVEECSE